MLPPRETSSGLRPAASSPSITQPVVTGLESSPGLAPKPPSLFWTETSQLAAVEPLALAFAGSVATIASARSSEATAAERGTRHSKRSRKRTSIRIIAGPAMSAKAMLPIACAASKGIPLASSTRKCLKVRSPPYVAIREKFSRAP